MDGNAMLTSTFLYIYSLESEAKEPYKHIVQNNLAFLKKNIIHKEGAYYYFDHEKKQPALTGQATANAWALLVFTEAADQLDNKEYKETAEHLAGYALKNLYDRNSGGFFTRNSNDLNYYAPHEAIDLSKQYEENAVFAYAMLRLYQQTNNAEYLEAGIKTVGYLINKSDGYDEMYYFLKAAKLVRDNNLLGMYETYCSWTA